MRIFSGVRRGGGVNDSGVDDGIFSVFGGYVWCFFGNFGDKPELLYTGYAAPRRLVSDPQMHDLVCPWIARLFHVKVWLTFRCECFTRERYFPAYLGVFAAIITARQHSLLCWRAVLAIVNLSVRLWRSVCQTLALCQNDSSYDHAVFTGG